MASGVLALLAFTPILLAGILPIGLRWPALYYKFFTGLIALAATYLLGVTDPLTGDS